MFESKTTLTLSQFLWLVKETAGKVSELGRTDLTAVPDKLDQEELSEALSMFTELGSAIEGIENTINLEAGEQVSEENIMQLRERKPLLFLKVIIDRDAIEIAPMADKEALKLLPHE
jgi:hypothetical protein